MLANGIIRRCEPPSPFSAPPVLVKKKDGTYRFCVDYRRLNNITVKDPYSIPRVDDALNALTGSRLYTTLDLASGYWHIQLAEEDKAKTAFTTRDGQFEFNVMPFGLANAPGTFQRAMDEVLRGLDNIFTYLDDIIIHSETMEEHVPRVRAVVQRLRDKGFAVNVSKCRFAATTVKYLGHVITDGKVSPDTDKTSAITDMPAPNSPASLRRFLGLASYYRKFIADFADIASPLYQLTALDQRDYDWTAPCEQAFITLKDKLTNMPILVLPDWSQEFTITTDASGTGMGAVLSQPHGILEFASRTLQPRERRQCTTEQECGALVWGLKKFRPYVHGRPFKVITDHRALVWLMKSRDHTNKLTRWALTLMDYDFTVVHQQGVDNVVADALSRSESTSSSPHDTVPELEDDAIPHGALS